MHGIFYICHENTSAAVIDFTRPTTQPWDWDVRLNILPEDWHQVALEMRKSNGIRDGDI